MKAVLASMPADIAAWRKRTSCDIWDETWEGVLHVPPMPNRFQQDLEGWLETYLRLHWAPLHKAKVYHQINLASIGGWPKDYRIPDVLLLKPERLAIDHNEYFEGAPTVVAEIHSPGDEAYEKLPFYAKLGVPEVWIIDRDSGEPEIHVLKGKGYRKKRSGSEGWLASLETGVELKAAGAGKLAIRLKGDDSTRQNLPPD